MPSRFRSRQRALQALFQWDLRKQYAEDAIRAFYDSLHTAEREQDPENEPPAPHQDPFMEQLVRGTVNHAKQIDDLIAKRSAHWRMERMPSVDRNLLRLAVYEMSHEDTPPPVVIDQALELARRFSGDEAVPFVNGVLDAIRKDLGK